MVFMAPKAERGEDLTGILTTILYDPSGVVIRVYSAKWYPSYLTSCIGRYCKLPVVVWLDCYDLGICTYLTLPCH